MWPETVVNQESVVACSIGYAGQRRRRCDSDGAWEEADETGCVRLHCASDGLWPATNTLTNATLPCGGSLLGEITRYCGEDQTWGSPDASGCRRDARRG